MSSRDCQYGIFIRNSMLRDTSKAQNPRTVFMGQICIVEGILKQGLLQVRLLKEGNTWESQMFITTSENDVIVILEKLWQYMAAISSPQERVKFAKNRCLCERLSLVCKDMVVGFTDSNDIKLGKIKYMGHIKGLGHGFGLELHEKRATNKCNGDCAGIQYFQCLPGRGLFTTIEKIQPAFNNSKETDRPSIDKLSPQNHLTDLDFLIKENMTDLFTRNRSLDKPPREEIVTKYGEYSEKLSTLAKSTQLNHNMRNSVSLQNILEVDGGSINTNNDFDQNTIIQPDRSQLMNTEKIKNKSEVDLHDLIGNSWCNSDPTKAESYTNLRKSLDRNDNIKEKYSPLLNRNSTISSNGTLSRSPRSKSINPINHLLEGTGTTKKSKFYTSDAAYIENNFEKTGSKVNFKKIENGKNNSYYA